MIILGPPSHKFGEGVDRACPTQSRGGMSDLRFCSCDLVVIFSWLKICLVGDFNFSGCCFPVFLYIVYKMYINIYDVY